MRLSAFRGLRYDSDVAGSGLETSAPAYDELDRLRYTRHRTTNPYTVLELLAGEGSEPGAGDAFTTARATLDRWERTGVLVADPSPAMYLYEEHELRHGVPVVQRGVVAAIDLDDVEDRQLLLHEDVDPVRAQSRAGRVEGVPVDLTPVVALHVGGTTPDLRSVMARARLQRPVVAFTDEGEIDHRVWRIDDVRDCGTIAAALADVPAVLADGHHRIAASLRIRDARRAEGRDPGGFAHATAWVVDALEDGPELRAIHRLVRGRPTTDEAGEPVVEGFHALPWRSGVHELEEVLASTSGLVVGLVTAGGAWVLRAEDESAVRTRAGGRGPALDVEVVESVIAPSIAPGAGLEPVVDVRGAAEEVVAGGVGSLILLRPPTAEQVLQVAAGGHRMPAKTTWFRPKPRAGLVMRRLDGGRGTA